MSNSRYIYRKTQNLDIILDDEKYFTLRGTTQPGNIGFWTSDYQKTPNRVKFYHKAKYEKKVLLYIAISPKGISKPILLPSGNAVTGKVYKKVCLATSLIPFIKKNYPDGRYVFWPDKASAHYCKEVVEYLGKKGIEFVPKDKNPTNLPQCRPIEDFFGYLSGEVYKNNWQAKDVKQLKRRIKKCIKEVEPELVQSLFSSLRRDLRVCAEKGPYALVH